MENLRFFHQDFCAWLETLNYSVHTINNCSSTVEQFHDFLEGKEVQEIKKVSAMHIHFYFMHLKSRANLRRGAGLSASYINKQIGSLKLYQKFLQLNHNIYIPFIQKYIENSVQDAEVLTVEEIRSLYDTCDLSHPVGYRDRAILSLYYGAGLRRSEGVNLTMKDVKLDQRIIHVRESKSRKERFVPMALKVYQDLHDYVLIARPVLKLEKTDKFLLSIRGKGVSKGLPYKRIQALQGLSREDSIHNKFIGLHTLRHSLATHLLQNGMSIERIARILGHSSISSTQIYTHLLKKQQ